MYSLKIYQNIGLKNLKIFTITIRVFCPRAGTSCKHRNQPAVLSGMIRCSSFLLLSTPHSLFRIWTDLKRSEKIPRAPMWRWGEWIWLTGPSGLHQNSLQGLNISPIKVFDQIRDTEIPITLCSLKDIRCQIKDIKSVCMFQCQPTALLRALGSTQGR